MHQWGEISLRMLTNASSLSLSLSRSLSLYPASRVSRHFFKEAVGRVGGGSVSG